MSARTAVCTGKEVVVIRVYHGFDFFFVACAGTNDPRRHAAEHGRVQSSKQVAVRRST